MTAKGTKPKNSKHPGVSIFARDGRTVAKWRDPKTGKYHQQSLDQLGLRTQRKRERWAIAKSEELMAAKLEKSLAAMASEKVTIADGLDRYAKSKPIAERTAKSRKVPFETFAAYCEEHGIQTLDDLTPDRLWPWRDQVVANVKLKETTRNLHFAVVRAFLNWAVLRDYSPRLPSEKVAALTQRLAEPDDGIEFLKPAEIRKVLEAAIKLDATPRVGSRPVAPFVMTTLLTGMRFAEVVGLDWSEVGQDDIDLPASRVKNRRRRSVSLRESPTLRQLFEVLRHEGRAEGLVFPPRFTPNGWRDYQLRVSAVAGVHFTPRMLRRTCGTIVANAPGIAGAASIWFAAKRLGHNVSVAERHYAGTLPGLPADAKTIEDAVGIRDVCEAIVEVARH